MRISLFPAVLFLSAPAAFAVVNSPVPGIDAASASNALGMLDLRAGDLKSAESHFRQAVSFAGEALGESHPDTALYETNLARALLLERQYGRAEVLLHRARYIIESASSPDPVRLGIIMAELAAVEADEKQFARAEADAVQSVALIARTVEPASLEMAVEQVMLATIYLQERRIDAAEKILPDAVALERRFADGAQVSHPRELAFAIRRLGQLRALQHNWTEAQALYGEAIQLFESDAGRRHPALAPMLSEYAAVLKRAGASRAAVKTVEARARALRA